jgi:hypothetical protein
MAMLPARRNGTLSRPGPPAPARRDPLAGSGKLYQRMSQLMRAAPGLGQGRHQRRAGRPGTGHQRRVHWHREERPGLLPGHAEADKIAAALAGGVLTVTGPKIGAGKPRRIQVTAG